MNHHLTLTEKEQFMRRALGISAGALPGCLPNPPVGCVITRSGQVVGEGFTQPPGSAHAEVMALSRLAAPLGDCSLFVTLEPCAFFGRTPSCARTLAELGARHVVVALIDPDPRNSGRGLHLLREAGATVEVGILAEEVDAFLKPYLSGTGTV